MASIEKIKTAGDLQTRFKELSNEHLKLRASDNPEFQREFIKTFSDLIFSQNDEMLEKLAKTKQNSLLNAVFKATEVGASFAKKEVSFIPFEIFKKEKKNGTDVKTATGEYDALVIFDINFQKQQILKLQNCKRFFTAEIHDGIKIINDLSTGNYSFIGDNDVSKPTIGYFAVFISTDGERYELFMSCAEIVERAKFSPQYKEANYKITGNSIHYEKIVIRNLMKLIPRVSEELRSIMSTDEQSAYTDYIDITEKKVNALDEAKKELSGKQQPENIENAEPENTRNAEKSEKTEAEAIPKKESTKKKDLFTDSF
ncbi:MAG: recombinase RecT [Bacteroidota bacterium]